VSSLTDRGEEAGDGFKKKKSPFSPIACILNLPFHFWKEEKQYWKAFELIF